MHLELHVVGQYAGQASYVASLMYINVDLYSTL